MTWHTGVLLAVLCVSFTVVSGEHERAAVQYERPKGLMTEAEFARAYDDVIVSERERREAQRTPIASPGVLNHALNKLVKSLNQADNDRSMGRHLAVARRQRRILKRHLFPMLGGFLLRRPQLFV